MGLCCLVTMLMGKPLLGSIGDDAGCPVVPRNWTNPGSPPGLPARGEIGNRAVTAGETAGGKIGT